MPLFSFEGLRPRIHPSAFVAPTATLVGDVIVEEGASVWYGVVIRADYAGDRAPARQRAGQRGDPRPARAHDRRRRGRDHRAQLRRARRAARGGCIVANGSVVLDGATVGAGAHRGRLGRRGRRVDPGRDARRRIAGRRAPSGEGQRRRDLGRDEPGRLRRARATPPPRHRLRRPRRGSQAQTDRSRRPEAESPFRGTGPTGLRRGWTRSRARRARAGSGTPRRGSRPRSRCRARTARGRLTSMVRTVGPAATTSAHTRRRSTLAVAGMRIPARDLRSPASGDGARSSRSAVMRIECLTSSCGSTGMPAQVIDGSERPSIRPPRDGAW